MKLIGLQNKTIQYVVFKLKDSVDISFPEDLRSSEVLICQDLSFYKKYGYEIQIRKLQYKVILFLDYIDELKTIKGIQIIHDITDSFISYIKNKCTYNHPRIKKLKDPTVDKKIEEIQYGSFFTKVVYPLIYSGIKNKDYKKEITRSCAISILECIKKQQPNIVKYKGYIKNKYLKAFLSWLETDEAKRVCECLITKTVKYNFDSFEINYLINTLEGE